MPDCECHSNPYYRVHTAHMHRHQPLSPQVTNSVIMVPQCLQKRMRHRLCNMSQGNIPSPNFGTNNARISACARSSSTQIGSMSPVRPFPVFNGKEIYTNMTCPPKASDREGLCQTRAGRARPSRTAARNAAPPMGMYTQFSGRHGRNQQQHQCAAPGRAVFTATATATAAR